MVSSLVWVPRISSTMGRVGIGLKKCMLITRSRRLVTSSNVEIFSEDVFEGLAMAPLGYWPSLNRTPSAVNVTTSSRHCNLGGAGCQSDNLVEIARV